MIWIANNLKTIAAVLVTAIVAFGLHSAHIAVLGWQHQHELAEQMKADKAACTKAQEATKEANDALTKANTDIARKLAAYKLRKTAACVPVIRDPQLLGGGGGYAGGDGISSEWLREYAARCELYRREKVICVKFLEKERENALDSIIQ